MKQLRVRIASAIFVLLGSTAVWAESPPSVRDRTTATVAKAAVKQWEHHEVKSPLALNLSVGAIALTKSGDTIVLFTGSCSDCPTWSELRKYAADGRLAWSIPSGDAPIVDFAVSETGSIVYATGVLASFDVGGNVEVAAVSADGRSEWRSTLALPEPAAAEKIAFLRNGKALVVGRDFYTRPFRPDDPRPQTFLATLDGHGKTLELKRVARPTPAAVDSHIAALAVGVGGTFAYKAMLSQWARGNSCCSVNAYSDGQLLAWAHRVPPARTIAAMTWREDGKLAMLQADGPAGATAHDRAFSIALLDSDGRPLPPNFVGLFSRLAVVRPLANGTFAILAPSAARPSAEATTLELTIIANDGAVRRLASLPTPRNRRVGDFNFDGARGIVLVEYAPVDDPRFGDVWISRYAIAE